MSALPWIEVAPCDAGEFAGLRRDVIFHGAKWDPQIGDTSTIGAAPLVLRADAWDELVRLATTLASELRTIERAALADVSALRRLGLGREWARMLAGAPHRHAIQLERFDFHYSTEGWRISEVNADVPGGLHEGRVGPLYAARWPDTFVPGDVAAAIAAAFARRCEPGSTVALVHATSYSDDRQVIALLERALADVGLVGIPCAPDHLRFDPVRVVLGPSVVPVAGIYRFFPAEWLPNLPRDADPRPFVRPEVVAMNPATALVAQSKRLPLVWDALGVAVPTFRALLPETREPYRAPLHREDWLLKPALGRVGGGIVGRSLSSRRAHLRGLVDAALAPSDYVAQRRFTNVPWRCGGAEYTVCVGVFTLDGFVVGAYGRSTNRPLVDRHAVDTPVLVAQPRRSRT